MGILILLLTTALLAVTAFFAGLGIAVAMRCRALAQQANRQALRFSPADPFDLPNRYGELTLFQCGHSPQARNVTHGSYHGKIVRTFDFYCELGHGTRRLTRRCVVVTVETTRPLTPLSVWNLSHPNVIPMEAHRLAETALPELDGAPPCPDPRLSELWPECLRHRASLETKDHCLCLYLPARMPVSALPEVMRLATAMAEQIPLTAAEPPGDSCNGEVAKAPAA